VQDLKVKEMDNIIMEDFDIFKLAEMGHSSIPISNVCYSDREEEIREQALKCFILDCLQDRF